MTQLNFALHPARKPLPSRAGYSYRLAASRIPGTFEDARITSRDDVSLEAWYVQPEAWNRKTVILLHGVGDNRVGITEYGLFLAKHGFAFLSPDLRAHGQSGGDVFSYGVNETVDVREWGDWPILL